MSVLTGVLKIVLAERLKTWLAPAKNMVVTSAVIVMQRTGAAQNHSLKLGLGPEAVALHILAFFDINFIGQRYLGVTGNTALCSIYNGRVTSVTQRRIDKVAK